MVRTALQKGVIANGELWMDMIQKRNEMAHQYDTAKALLIYEKIRQNYLPEIKLLKSFVQNRYGIS